MRTRTYLFFAVFLLLCFIIMKDDYAAGKLTAGVAIVDAFIAGIMAGFFCRFLFLFNDFFAWAKGKFAPRDWL